MSKKSVIKFKLAELKAFVNDPKSCVKCVRQKQHLSIAPWCLSDLKGSIESILNNKTGKYDRSLEGILLSAKNITLLSSLGALRNDSPEIHLDIDADFYIFHPEIDSVLEGVIVKKSTQFLGCLVHKVFNISIPRLNDQKNWPGRYLEIGQNVTFKIVSMDLLGKLPYIRGEIDESAMEFEEEEEYISEMTETQDDSGTSKKRKKNKKKYVEDVSEINDSTEQANGDDTVDYEIKPKKQKKNKKNVQDTSELSQEENDQNNSISKKKKKRDKNTINTNFEDTVTENSDVIQKKKQKSKSKYENDETVKSDMKSNHKSKEVDSYSIEQNSQSKTLSINKDKYKIAKLHTDYEGYSSECASEISRQRKNSIDLSTRRSPEKFKKKIDSTDNSKTKNDLLNALMKVAQNRCSVSPAKKSKQHKQSNETLNSPTKEKNNNNEVKSERKHKRKVSFVESPDISPVKKMKMK